MSSVLRHIVESGELQDVKDVEEAKLIVLEAFEVESNNKENRRFRYEVSVCVTVEDVQKITYNAYLKRLGMAVIK